MDLFRRDFGRSQSFSGVAPASPSPAQHQISDQRTLQIFYPNIFLPFQVIKVCFEFPGFVHFLAQWLPSLSGKFGVRVKIARMRRYISIPTDLATTIPSHHRPDGPSRLHSSTTRNALWSHAIVRMAINNFSMPLLKKRLLRRFEALWSFIIHFVM
jgi:hypothetical protein